MASTATNPHEYKCPFLWLYFEPTHSCYFHSFGYNWSHAEQWCVNESAHLTSLHSQEEARFLVGMHLLKIYLKSKF